MHDEIKLKTDDKHIILLTDVAYGACNVDYSLLRLMGVDSIVHFGHSRLLKPELPSLYIMCNRLDFQEQPLAEMIKKFCVQNQYTNIGVTSTS